MHPGADLALLLIDLDNLKSINNSVGHGVGDEVLRGTARRIQGCLRTTDIVSRLSGDEFAVLLPRVGDRSNVEVIARRIVEAVQRPYPAELHSCTVRRGWVAMLERGPAAGSAPQRRRRPDARQAPGQGPLRLHGQRQRRGGDDGERPARDRSATPTSP